MLRSSHPGNKVRVMLKVVTHWQQSEGDATGFHTLARKWGWCYRSSHTGNKERVMLQVFTQITVQVMFKVFTHRQQSQCDDDDDDDDCFYIALFSALEHSLRSHVILHEWLAFYSAFLNIHQSGVLYSAGMAGATWNCCPLGASSVYTIQPCACHFMQSHKRKVYACLTVTAICTFGKMTGIIYVLLR